MTAAGGITEGGMKKLRINRLQKQLFVFFQGFLMLNLVWTSAYLFTETTVIPNPLLVYQKIPQAFADGIFWHIMYSLYRIFMGLILALGIGIPLGIIMAYSKIINKILYPFIYFSYPIPKTALLPVAMLLLGMRDASKITIVFLVIVFQVIVSVRDAVNGIDPSLYRVLKASGAGPFAVVRHITIPAILLPLFTSLRISLGTAVSILFFVESYGTKYGMGYYIIDAWSRIQYVDMYLGILTISVIGFLLFALVDLLSQKTSVYLKQD